MGKQLILTEKKTVARKFVTALAPDATEGAYCFEGGDYLIVFLSGHLLRLAPPKVYRPEWRSFSLSSLPINPETFLFEPIPGREKHFTAVKNYLQRPDIQSVVIATDCGREGETLGRLVLREAGIAEGAKPLWRFWTSGSLTAEHIREVMGRLLPAEVKEPLFQSGLARMIADWLMGVNATRALSTRFSRSGEIMDMGRVKATILRLLMQRQNERENFVAEDFWTIKGRFRTHQGEEFLAGWVGTGGRGGSGFLPEKPLEESPDDDGSQEEGKHEEGSRFRDKYDSHRAVNRICTHGMSWTTMKQSLRVKPNTGPDGPVRGQVVDVAGEVKGNTELAAGLKTVQPPQLFSLTTLQQEAHRLYGFSMDQTSALAQTLYLDLDLITYPRTESVVLNSSMLNQVKAVFQTLEHDQVVEFDPDRLVLALTPRLFDDKAIVEDHHAIIPSGQPASLDRMTPEQRKLYLLIVRRFVAAFYPPFTYRSVKVEVRIEQETFRASKTIIRDGGWKEFYNGRIKSVGRRDTIESLSAGTEVVLKYLFLHHGRTQMPPLLNDASLLQALVHIDRYIGLGETPERGSELEALKRAMRASSGVGTPASRPNILREMIENGMVYRLGRGKGLEVQEKGRVVFRAIEHLDKLDIETSARWELALNNIARGQGENFTGFLNSVRAGMQDLVESVRGLPQTLADEFIAIGHCPACSAPVIERPQSYSCRHYPQCNFVLWKNRLALFGKETITPEEARDLLEGHPILLRNLHWRNGKTFSATGTLGHSPDYGWSVLFDAKGKPAPAKEVPPLKIPASLVNPPVPAPPVACASVAAPPVRRNQPPEEKAINCCRPTGKGGLPRAQRPSWYSEEALALSAQQWLSASETPFAAMDVLRQIRGPLTSEYQVLSRAGLDLVRAPLPQGVSSLWALVRRGEQEAVGEWVSNHRVRPTFGVYQRVRYAIRYGEGEGVIQEIKMAQGLYVLVTKDDSGSDEDVCLEREIPWEQTCCYICRTPGVWVIEEGNEQ